MKTILFLLCLSSLASGSDGKKTKQIDFKKFHVDTDTTQVLPSAPVKSEEVPIEKVDPTSVDAQAPARKTILEKQQDSKTANPML